MKELVIETPPEDYWSWKPDHVSELESMSELNRYAIFDLGGTDISAIVYEDGTFRLYGDSWIAPISFAKDALFSDFDWLIDRLTELRAEAKSVFNY